MNRQDSMPGCETFAVPGSELLRTGSSLLPEDWKIPFPLGNDIGIALFDADSTRRFGIVVYRFSESEARFVLRGNLDSGEDLITCLKAGEDIARQLESRQLVTQEKFLPDWLDAANVFKGCGFESIDESWSFECPFAPFAERSNRIMKILERHGAVPKDARVSGIAEGREQVRAILQKARLLDGFDFDQHLKIDGGGSISNDYSRLVWVGQTLAGIILVAPTGQDGIFEIPIRYIIPSYRKTWVNAVLIHSCIKRGEVMGAATIRFSANSKTHRETIRLAKKAGCVRVAASHRYGQQLF